MRWSTRLVTVVAADAVVGLLLLAATPFVYSRVAAFGAPADSLQWNSTGAVALVQVLLAGLTFGWLQRNSLKRATGWGQTWDCFLIPAVLFLVAMWGVIQGTPAQAARQGHHVYSMAAHGCLVIGGTSLFAAFVLASWNVLEHRLLPASSGPDADDEPSNQRIEQTARR